jgi:beta-lactamase superfamily II metal-dependent hydrolase
MYEVDFLPVGDSNADAICIRYGDEIGGYYLHVVDGGYTVTGQTIIDHIEKHYGAHYFVNHLVLSHADNDHAAGLIAVMKRFKVNNLWMNRPWLYASDVLHHFHGNYSLPGLIQEMRERHPYLVELEKLAMAQGTVIHETFQGAQIGAFTVLAPSRARYIDMVPDLEKTPTSYRDSASESQNILAQLYKAAKEWIDESWDIETLSDNPEPTSSSNESSVVQIGNIDNEYILLTADAGPIALTEAADYAQKLGMLAPPACVQIPHHGSRRNVTPTVLDRWLGKRVSKGIIYGYAYCSVGKTQSDYPRGQVKNAFTRRGYPVHATRGFGKYHYHGVPLRDGWVASTAEPFADRVDV